MASIQTRTRATGDTAYRVMFRIDGKLVGETFNLATDADAFARSVDRMGGQAARDIRLARKADQDVLLLKDWLEDHVSRLTGIQEGTRRGYRSAIRDHINPTLGDYPLTALGRRQVEAWVNVVAPRVKAKTLRNVHSILSAALKRAVHDDLIPSNPAQSVRLPAADHTKVEMVTLTEAEFIQLLSAFPAHYQPLVVTMVGTGMRWGEITALPVGACDLDAEPPTLRVQQAWKHTGKSKRDLGPPKTRRGRRTIAISRSLANQLRPLIEGQPADAYLFTGVKGGVVDHAHFYERVWKPALKASGLSKTPRIHDLRHTYATNMAPRIPLDQLQRLLGHNSIQTTVDVYGHARAGDAAAASRAVEEMLSGALPVVESAGKDLVQKRDDVGVNKPLTQHQH